MCFMEETIIISLVFWEHDNYNQEIVEDILSSHNKGTFINILHDNESKYIETLHQRAFFQLEKLLTTTIENIIDDIWPKILINNSLQIYSVIERNLLAKGQKAGLNELDRVGIAVTHNLMKIFSTYAIKRVIFFDTPHHPVTILAFYIARHLEIDVIVSKGMPIHHGLSKTRRRYVTNNFPFFDKNTQADLQLESSLGDNTEKKILQDDLNEYINNYSISNKVNYNKRHLGTRWTYNYIFKHLYRATLAHLKEKKLRELVVKVIKYVYFLITENFTRKIILSYYNKLTIEFDTTSRYIYFPMQYQPEATTTPLGVPYRDHLDVIRIIRNSVPKDYKIFVREHPAYWHRKSSRESIKLSRSKNFYKTITSMPNVFLISPKSNHVDLIKNSALIVSITGTALWESFFYNKKSIMFGQYIYKDLPNVTIYNGKNSFELALKSTGKFFSEEKHILSISKLLQTINEITYLYDFNYPRSHEINLRTELLFIFNYLDRLKIDSD